MMKLEDKPLLTKADKITADDPIHFDKKFRGGTHFKSYDVTLKAEQICVIEMASKSDPAKGAGLWPRVLIESNANQLAEGSRVVIFRAPAAGKYRIIATGSIPRFDFTLSVRTVE